MRSSRTLQILGIVGILGGLYAANNLNKYAKSSYTLAGSPELYPNHNLTPGAVNADISQNNINQNICNPHWSTKSIRPPASYTTALKKKQLANGYTIKGDVNLNDYEEDHFISLELGGDPKSEKNLWPESYLTQPVNAKDKDKVENELHKEVCAGKITLKEAQEIITTDWYKFYLQIK